MKKIISLILSVVLLLTFSACSGETAGDKNQTSPEKEEKQPENLTGRWKQSNSESEISYQAGFIYDDIIEIYWISEENEMTALYWAGTYEAPETAEEPYSWLSQNDKDRTDFALLASGDDTKEFTYENGTISYSASLAGVTKVQKLEKIGELTEEELGELRSQNQMDETEDTDTQEEQSDEEEDNPKSENGYGRNNPAPIGVAQTLEVERYTGNYTVTVKIEEILSGEAMESVMGPAVANDTPDDGFEFVIVKAYLSLDKYDSDGSLQFDKHNFEAYTSNNESVKHKYVNLEKGGYFDRTVYEGGVVEGYMAFQRKIGDVGAKIAFGLDYDGQNGVWFAL